MVLLPPDCSESWANEFTEYPLPMSDMHSPSLRGALRRRSQTDPFPSAQLESHLATHPPEPQMTPGNTDQSAPLARRTSLSSFPVHPLPSQFASGPLHTPYNTFPGQYVMSMHPPPFQNQLSQSHVYHEYCPIEPSPYPAIRYYPLPRYQPQPYFPHQSNAHGGNSSYQQPRHLPPPMFHPAVGSHGPSHTGSYGGIQQYLPGNFGSPQQFQPSMYRWYQGPASSMGAFIKGDQMQVQHHYPMTSAHPQSQRPYGDLRAQSTGTEPLPSPSLDPSSSSISVTASRHTISPATCDSPEQTSVNSSPKMDTHQLSQKLVVSTSRAQDRPPARRHYHPNPPPNRSEWVMWVGNIPSDATQDELWRFLKQPTVMLAGSEGSSGAGESGVVSVYLISRSSCAFVNYQSEEHLERAIFQFSGRKLRPHDRRCPRLVCRARRKEDDLRAGVGAQRGTGVHTRYVNSVLRNVSKPLGAREETASSKGHRSDQSETSDAPVVPSVFKDEETLKSDAMEDANNKAPTQSPSSYASTSSSFLSRHFPKRFFILKSLSRYDLDLSTERGVWATQKHNEAVLDQAFRTSREVILIFSVNKSGEFYGHARMASGIFRGNRSISWAPSANSSPSTSSPSTSRVPTYGSPEQPGSRSRQSQMFTSPPERPSVEGFPFPLARSSDKTNDGPGAATSSRAKSAHERWSAPPVLNCNPEDPVNSDLPPPSGFSPSRQGRSQVSQIPDHSSDPDAHLDAHPSSTLQLEWGKYPGVWPGARSKGGGTDDSSNLGLRLLPVVEEVRTESGIEEGQLVQAITPPPATHGRRRGQGTSWGETFKVEWLCTKRVPFHRTRHLRNPWNHGREIKVSRDGTELEPGVGQQLVDSWSTLAREATGGYDARRPAGLAGRRGGKSASRPAYSAERKYVEKEYS